MKKVTILINVEFVSHKTQQSPLVDLQNDTAQSSVLSLFMRRIPHNINFPTNSPLCGS